MTPLDVMNHMRERYREAPTFREFLEEVEENRDLWHAVYQRVRLPEELLARARKIGEKWKLLALAEDWCGDAVNLLPVIARLAEEVPGWELRVLSRDENPDLMDAHLTGGRSRSIPVVIFLDESFRERGWWGPRPRDIQEWVVEEGLDLPSKERYKELRRRYARDRGRSTAEEIVELAESACALC